MAKAIFIDKDGTLIPDIPYNVNPALITISTHAIEGLKALQDNGYLVIVISNQSGVARGLFKEEQLADVELAIKSLLAVNGIKLHGFYYCPHHPDGTVEGYDMECACRKPQPGLLLQASKDHDVDLSQSWMIGDILNDVEAGNRAGCQTILIDNGGETEWVKGEYRTPTLVYKTINDAALGILQQHLV